MLHFLANRFYFLTNKVTVLSLELTISGYGCQMLKVNKQSPNKSE